MRLPPKFSSLIPTIHWPSYNENNGGVVSSFRLPMSYQPLSQLVEWRRKDESMLRHNENDLSSVILDIPQSVEEITSCLQSNEEEHYGILSLACILLGHGFADEAHDLVTPLSWPEDTYFGYVAKPSSTYHSTSVDVITFASYIHSLIHRYEGFEIGEYGMMGYANSKYWMNSALSSSANQLHELLHDIQHSIGLHVEKHHGTNKDIQNWYQDNIVASTDMNWDPKVLIQLCQNVQKKALLLNTNQNKDAESIMLLSQFSKECCEIELRQLLKHCLKHSGYKQNDDFDIVDTASDDCMNVNNNVAAETIDSYLSQKVANKVSFAHIQSFASNDSVLLRRVWDSTKENESLSLSVACGVACRLLETSSVSVMVSPLDSKGSCMEDDDIIFVHLPTSEINLKDGRSLTCGDVLATRSKVEEMIGDYSYVFRPCAHPEKAIFTDQFYGSRGSTPTTVIQWSKGTIF